MCGIAGLCNLNKEALDPRLLEKMCDHLAHRGPDDEGYVFIGEDIVCTAGGKSTPESICRSGQKYRPSMPISKIGPDYYLGLGHRRLSIIDLSAAGHQPMCSDDGKVWIVFNGEIYNYIELRSELQSLGRVFSTNSDTEVLLHAYLQWGIGCLDKLNGMWAFVIYDGRRNVLFGSRDRFGVKPFYYYFDKDRFAFASEIKALVELPFYKKAINDSAVFAYLVLQEEEGKTGSIFKNIVELQPSQYFIFDLNKKKLDIKSYYSLKYTMEWEDYDDKKAADHILTTKQHIFDAVKLRLRSDVPVGYCLSGGIDSSSIACVVNALGGKQGRQNQKAFTSCFDSPQDESSYAQQVVAKTGIQWFRSFPDYGELMTNLEDLVYYQDIPFGDGSIFAENQVMKLANEQRIKVLMNGQGGDEIFSGYPSFYIAYFAEMLKHIGLARSLRSLEGQKNSPINAGFIINNYLRYGLSKLIPFEIYALQYRSKFFTNSYIDDDLWGKNKQQLVDKKETRFNSLNAMLCYSMTMTNMKTHLRVADRNSMRFSIETRTPFTDDVNLINYIFSVPSSYKMHDGWSKYLLRESMKGIIPETIRTRTDKIGYVTPEAKWMNDLKEELKTYFTPDLAGYFKVDKMLADWDDIFRQLYSTDESRVWRLINFAVWKKVYKM